MNPTNPRITGILRSISSIAFFSVFAVHISSIVHGQGFNLWGCGDTDTCDVSNSSGTADDIVKVVNYDIGQGFELSGSLHYYRNATPPGIVTSVPALAGVVLTDATITYSPTATSPTYAEFDLIYFEYPAPGLVHLKPGGYGTIARYDGYVTKNSVAPSTFHIRTFPNSTFTPPSTPTNGLNPVTVPTSTATQIGSTTNTLFGLSAAITNPYRQPAFGTDNMFVIAGIMAQPGDVFHFPTSIEVAVYSVPEPSTTALLLLGLVPFGLHRRRS